VSSTIGAVSASYLNQYHYKQEKH